MEKRYKIGVVIFLVLLGTLVFLEASKPIPVNWNPSYAHIDKIPLGTYVFFESLTEKYPESVREIKNPPFEFLNDSSLSGTYFFLNRSIAFGEAELDKVLAWAAKGNTVFISASHLGHNLLDTLNLEIGEAMSYNTLKSEPLLNFVNPNLKAGASYHYLHDTDLKYFTEIDTLAQTVLGVADLYEGPPVVKDTWVNFIKAPFGKGKIFIHLFPQAFGNYFMLLKDNHEYAEKAMAYINFNQPVYWDGHYKIGNPFQTSSLYILLGNKYLKWAYYFVLIAAFLFVLFEGKRKQKSIQVVPRLQNKTHDFTRTVAGMYLQEKSHNAIAQKQISLFLNFVRTHWRVNTQELDDGFLKTLSDRSGKAVEETRELFKYIAETQKKETLTKTDLKKLNQLINTYKRNN